MLRLRLLIAALSPILLGSCAHQFMESAQNECTSFGYAAGTDAYSSCVQEQYARNQEGFQQRLLNASRIGNEGMPSMSSGSSWDRTLSRSYVSGANRICHYGAGQGATLTIRASESCPETIP